MSSFELHPKAIRDLDEIAAYYSEPGLGIASKLIREFFDAFDLLHQFPHSGFLRPELTRRPLRFKVVRQYLIAYAPATDPLFESLLLFTDAATHA